MVHLSFLSWFANNHKSWGMKINNGKYGECDVNGQLEQQDLSTIH